MKNKVFFRVDASVKIGLGHAKRCLIIAKEILKKKDVEVFFLSKELPDFFIENLRKEGIKVVINNDKNTDEYDFLTKYIEKENTILIVDSYKNIFYDADFQKNIKGNTKKLAYIVFDNKYHYYTDILHNQNPLATVQKYSIEPYTKCLFGLKNLIIDENFRKISNFIIKNKEKNKKKVAMLTFGGSDPYNLTLTLLKSLSLIKNKFEKYIVVIGKIYPFEKELQEFVSISDIRIELHKNPDKMHKLMLNSDVAFISGGITTWEFGVLGIPVIIFPFGEKVLESAKLLQKFNLAQYVDNPLKIKSKELAKKIDNLLLNDIEKKAELLKKEININGVNNFVNSLF